MKALWHARDWRGADGNGVLAAGRRDAAADSGGCRRGGRAKGVLEKHDIEIGAGLGPLAGKVWRIGVMGHTARPENIERLLAALREPR